MAQFEKLVNNDKLLYFFSKLTTIFVRKDGTKVLSDNNFTDAEKTKLAGIESGAQVNTVTGVKGASEVSYRTGNVNITPENIGLGNVDNTSDASKPVSTATQNALDQKVDVQAGKGLSSNDFTDALKAVLESVETGAQVNTITGVKGNAEANYRTGEVNITPANVGAKGVQQAVSDPSSDGASLSFISNISQDAQGVITPVKKTVSPMTGASAAAAGEGGLVPEPQIGDQGKFLGGDGSWHALAKGDVGLGNVDNTSDNLKPISAATQTALDGKAPLISPQFSGNPTAPTPTAGDDSDAIATTAFVADAITQSLSDITGIDFQVVQSLPQSGTPGTFYLVAHNHGSGDSYDEYVWVNNAFEKVGHMDIDLSNYVQFNDITIISNADIDTIITNGTSSGSGSGSGS